MTEPRSTRSVYPDKKREPNLSTWNTYSPRGDSNDCGPVLRIGNTPRSLSDNSLHFGRQVSFGNKKESSRSLKVIVTPLSPDGNTCKIDEETCADILNFASQQTDEFKRPLSPRPSNLQTSLSERNKQLHIWDSWSSSVFCSSRQNIASIKYKRTGCQNLPQKLPKQLGLQRFSEELD